MPDCSIQSKTWSIRGLFAMGNSALGLGMSSCALVSGTSL